MSTCDKYCRGCGHYRGGNGTYCCEYLLDVGHRRPCPPGEGCTEHTKNAAAPQKKYVNPMALRAKPGHKPGVPAPNRKIEPAKARELFADGKTDAEIAAVFGAAEITVRRWRASQGLIRKEEGGPGRPPIKKEDKIMEETSVMVSKEPEGMTVEQMASLFANMGKVGKADRVTAGGQVVRGVVVTVRYDAKNGDSPASLAVELEV